MFMIGLGTEAVIKGLGRIIEAEGHFAKMIEDLKAIGAKIISPRDLAYGRIHSGRSSSLSQYGSYTSAGFLYATNAQPLIALQSRLLISRFARMAVEKNQYLSKVADYNHFSTNDLDLYEIALKQAQTEMNICPEQRTVSILPKKSLVSIGRNDDVFKMLFKDQSAEYTNFTGLDTLQMYLVKPDIVDKTKGTLLTQLYLEGLSRDSDLVGDKILTDHNISIRGLQEEPAKKISKLQQILGFFS
jgi:hypothetical protein